MDGQLVKSVKQFIFIALAALGFMANLQAQRCVVCDLGITAGGYLMTDRITGEQKPVCKTCALLSARCYLCGLPVKNNFTQLPDGRVLCARDSKGVVLSEDEANQVCIETRNELNRLFSGFPPFPATNLSITVVDKIHMEQLFQRPGFERQCPSIFGYAQSRPDEEGELKHSIHLLGGLPKARMMAVCAHEMTHAWLNEQLPPDRFLSRDAIEGFCELVSYKLMAHLGEEQEQQVIKANYYTRGQIALLRQADDTYGFYTIVQWMKSGLDGRLSGSDLDRIRMVGFQQRQSTFAETISFPQQGLTPVPDTLTLIGIAGSGGRRFALINDHSFDAGESAKVRVGKTNVVVRCLEIRGNSAFIEVEGSPEKEELTLKSK